MDATGGESTVILPTAASSADDIIRIKKIDAGGNKVIVDGDTAETIDGSTTQDLIAQYDTITVISDGTEWWIL